MKVPCSGPVYNQEEIDNIKDAAETFYNVEGKYTEAFEKGLCDYLGMKYCVLCNSGSSANLLAITALGLKQGSEVITTACGFPTTLNPIIQNNLIPVFVDINGTLTIDPITLSCAVKKTRAKALVIAHTLGIPCEMDRIMSLAKKHHLKVVEDNCDALGSRFSGQLTGTFGDISTLSFYPAHHITTGEGGVALTNNSDLYRKMLSLRNWGRDCICRPGQDNACGNRFSKKFGKMPCGYDHKYIYTNIGYNLKMTNLQASIGVAQLKKLDSFVTIRKQNYTYLYDNLKKHERYFNFIEPNPEASMFGFPIICDDEFLSVNGFMEYLEGNGIATRRIFGGNLLLQPAYRKIKHKVIGRLSHTNYAMENAFWIGIYPGINKEQLDHIIQTFNQFMEGL